VVLRKQTDQFSAIYIKGEIEINQVDNYLRMIKNSLDRQMRSSQSGMFQLGNQFAFAMPSFDNFKVPEFDSEAFNLRMEEAKRSMEESMERLKDRDGFLQQDIQNALEKKQKQFEGAQQQIEENKIGAQ